MPWMPSALKSTQGAAAQLATLTAVETELLGSCSAQGWKVRPVATTMTLRDYDIITSLGPW